MPDINHSDRTGNCRICERRDYLKPHVCDPCRTRLWHRLSDLYERWTLLAYPDGDLTADTRTVTITDTGTTTFADPVAATIPAAPIPSPSTQPRVSGTRDKQVPIDVTRLDLLAPVTRDGGIPVDSITTTPVPVMETVTVMETMYISGAWHTIPIRRRQPVLDPAGNTVYATPDDQVGKISIAQILDQWVRAWMETLGTARHRPAPTVPSLVYWLSDNLFWACDNYSAIGDFDRELHDANQQLGAILDLHDSRPTLCDGVECGQCGHRNCLFLNPEPPPGPDAPETRWVECTLCGALYSPTEYQDLVKTQHAHLNEIPDAP